MRLIDSLRNFATSLLHKPDAKQSYRYHPCDVVIEDFSEFSGISLNVIAERIANFRRINADDWFALDAGSFPERAAAFYISSKNYIYDSLSANPSTEFVIAKLDRFNPRIMESIRAHPGDRFLEFGAGTGVFCEIVARMGKKVYYMDIPGIVFDFAQWRFKKLGLNVTAIMATPDKIHLQGKYDIIFTDAVLEHLPKSLQIEATIAIGRAMDDGGLLIFLVDLSGPTEDDPMHHDVDIIELHEQLSSSGLRCEDGFNSFCSIWRRSR